MATGDDNSMKGELDGLSKRFDGVDKRLDGVDKRLDGVDRRLDGVNKRLDVMDKRFDGVNKRLDAVDKKVDNLANSTRMQFETIREDIKKLGEGYESGLKMLSQKLASLDKRWAARWSIHDAVLKNHAKRITTLEQHHADRGDQ